MKAKTVKTVPYSYLHLKIMRGADLAEGGRFTSPVHQRTARQLVRAGLLGQMASGAYVVTVAGRAWLLKHDAAPDPGCCPDCHTGLRDGPCACPETPPAVDANEVKRALGGLLHIARIAMPDTYFATDSRVRRAQKLLVRLGGKAVK